MSKDFPYGGGSTEKESLQRKDFFLCKLGLAVSCKNRYREKGQEGEREEGRSHTMSMAEKRSPNQERSEAGKGLGNRARSDTLGS